VAASAWLHVVARAVSRRTAIAQGLAAFRVLSRALRGACPDVHFPVDEAIGERDVAAVRWTARMTHAGDHLGFPATQKRFEISGMTFARIENGKIAEAWDNWDMLGMMNAIGQNPHTSVVPPG